MHPHQIHTQPSIGNLALVFILRNMVTSLQLGFVSIISVSSVSPLLSRSASSLGLCMKGNFSPLR